MRACEERRESRSVRRKSEEEVEGEVLRTEQDDGLVRKNPALEFLLGRGSWDTERPDGWIESLVVEGVGSRFRDGDGGDEFEVGEEDWRERTEWRRVSSVIRIVHTSFSTSTASKSSISTTSRVKQPIPLSPMYFEAVLRRRGNGKRLTSRRPSIVRINLDAARQHRELRRFLGVVNSRDLDGFVSAG